MRLRGKEKECKDDLELNEGGTGCFSYYFMANFDTSAYNSKYRIGISSSL